MVYVGGHTGAGGAKIVFGEIPVTTLPTDAVTVTLGGTPKYLSVIPKQANKPEDTYALPCAFSNPVIGDYAFVNATDPNSNTSPVIQITIKATGFTAQRLAGTDGKTAPFGYLAIM